MSKDLVVASRSCIYKFEEAKWVTHGFEVLDVVMYGKRKKKNSKFEKLKFLSCMPWNFIATFFTFEAKVCLWIQALNLELASNFVKRVERCEKQFLQSREFVDLI